MRVTRDKRGFENTVVVHSERRRGKMRNRILYWFRTPPGVKVGRTALDDEAMRRIEEQNPSIEFDWPRIIKGQGSPASEPRPPAEVRRSRAPQPETQAAPPRSDVREATRTAGFDHGADADPPVPAEPILESPEPEPEIIIPAHARLGSDGVARLRVRYREILVRISETTSDPARCDELKFQADHLNPDTWTSDDEVRAGLEQYESIFATLKELIGPRRRRRRQGAPEETAEAEPMDQPGPDQSSDAPNSGSHEV